MTHITGYSDPMSSNKVIKAFYKKTRRGSVIRIVREKFLRNDTECGYLHNQLISSNELHKLVLNSPHKHILIVDTNIVLHQIDILEYKCPATSLIIFTQTVLQEVRHNNLSVYRRVTALLKDETKNCIFYPNEIASFTATLR